MFIRKYFISMKFFVGTELFIKIEVPRKHRKSSSRMAYGRKIYQQCSFFPFLIEFVQSSGSRTLTKDETSGSVYHPSEKSPSELPIPDLASDRREAANLTRSYPPRPRTTTASTSRAAPGGPSRRWNFRRRSRRASTRTTRGRRR